MERQTHGGTWYTYDYAKKKNKPIILITGFGSLLNLDEIDSIDCLLNKPIQSSELMKAIYSLVKRT